MALFDRVDLVDKDDAQDLLAWRLFWPSQSRLRLLQHGQLLVTKRLRVVQLLVQPHVHGHELVNLQQDVLERLLDLLAITLTCCQCAAMSASMSWLQGRGCRASRRIIEGGVDGQVHRVGDADHVPADIAHRRVQHFDAQPLPGVSVVIVLDEMPQLEISGLAADNGHRRRCSGTSHLLCDAQHAEELALCWAAAR